eukprot:CAMPEP_0202350624 /NCGR_PEP_ID=MMETSP1126-20121109/7619_1 /ASSEMBLY_ACC=CAM_ASM_000457 /TAXON_ID=3047 /ORGANISM="Dunaliella tertiolecta, Strain CCMP1320" /LENGTH=66 /DNA_ID=CAMNT_0048942627 /DNA_START=250 /DNA_END=447 /DNA_ORIENTATION=-
MPMGRAWRFGSLLAPVAYGSSGSKSGSATPSSLLPSSSSSSLPCPAVLLPSHLEGVSLPAAAASSS